MGGVIRGTGTMAQQSGQDVANEQEHPVRCFFFGTARFVFFLVDVHDTGTTELRFLDPGDRDPESLRVPLASAFGDPVTGKLCQLAGELFRGFGR